MKLLVMLPHGNTAAFLEKQRLAIAEKTGDKIFAFSPLYCPLAVVPDKDYTATEAKKLLTGARDAITNSRKKENCTLEKLHAASFGSVTAFFVTGSFSFLEDIRAFCEKNGFEPLASRTSGFCAGFSCGTCTKADEKSDIPAVFEPHRMTVFQLALVNFSPKTPFLWGTLLNADGKSGTYSTESCPCETCGSAENAEPLSFKWKLISSVWKAKQKEA